MMRTVETTSLPTPFSPLLAAFGDLEMAEIFSERSLVESWLTVERELALAQAELNVIPAEAGAAIFQEAVIDKIDFAELWKATRAVGYPIVPLIEQIAARSSPLVGDYIHWGATTQDVMDTGLVLQLRRALDRSQELERSLGDELCQQADAYRSVPMAARTHAQQAVPTTLGAKFAIWLEELGRHLERLTEVRRRSLTVQLFGAGGTSAALGPIAGRLRRRLAEGLGIGWADVPWHTSRDSLAELGLVVALAASTCGKIAREIIELSRTEIGEVREQGGESHGASSTMPQKANPSRSEAVVGLSVVARDRATVLLGAMQGSHERSTGEWQSEWDVVPELCSLAAACLANTTEVLGSLRVFPERMDLNLQQEGGLIMAEAAMMALAPAMGRLKAYELVGAACQKVRHTNQGLAEALTESLGTHRIGTLTIDEVLAPRAYLGEAEAMVASARGYWQETRSQAREAA